MQTYSPFFQTLHDETGPVGVLGRGTHYSVLRATVFHDEFAAPLPKAKFLDFAVIWDEDHDTRSIVVIERLYRSGDLSSFIIFGERKGSFSCLPASGFNDVRLPQARTAVETACSDILGDDWNSYIIEDVPSYGYIINSDSQSVELYLNNIKLLWRLGLKEIIEPKIDEIFPDSHLSARLQELS